MEIMARRKSVENTIVPSKKETILAYIETLMHTIKKSNVAFEDKATNIKYYYNNDVGYVDRQFENITQDDIKKNGYNWIIINEKSHKWQQLIGGGFENKLQIQIVAFTRIQKQGENLSTLMNSLQKDVFTAILKDVELGNMCSYIVPLSESPVDNMIYPYGGVMMNFEIVYVAHDNLDF